MWNVECHRSGARNEQSGAWLFDVTSDVIHGEYSAGRTLWLTCAHRGIPQRPRYRMVE
jgi:hypothetical protein